MLIQSNEFILINGGSYHNMLKNIKLDPRARLVNLKKNIVYICCNITNDRDRTYMETDLFSMIRHILDKYSESCDVIFKYKYNTYDTFDICKVKCTINKESITYKYI